jgi:hypothetical protein
MRLHAPDVQFNLLDDSQTATVDLGTLTQYDRLIVLLAPEFLSAFTHAEGPAQRILTYYASLWDGGRRQIVPVILRPVGKLEFVELPRPIEAESLYAAQLADLFAREHLLDGLPDDGRPDTQYVWEDIRVGGLLPPPPPPAYPPEEPPSVAEVPLAGAPAYDWPTSEDERGWVEPPSAPPPPPAPTPEQPAAQPRAAPPPAPPTAPGAVSPPSAPSGSVAERVGAPIFTPPWRSRDRAPQPIETLQFTAYHSNDVAVETSQTVLLYTHLGQQVQQVQQDAGTFAELGSAPATALGTARRKIPRNIEITVEPHMEGVSFSPAQDSFIWRGEWHRSLFRYVGTSALAGTVQQGRIDVYADRISPICTVAVAFSFHAGIPAKALSVPHGINVTSNIFDRVFISYSHRDQEAMRQARKTYEKLGITAYHDDLLQAGENYEQRLAKMIRASNIFHLLWSDASARSPEVRKELLLALSANNIEQFIRPWYWQRTFVPPPPELEARKISFRYEHLRRRLFSPGTWL